MTANLVIWKWADQYQKPYARRKEGLSMFRVIREFMLSEDQSKFAEFDQDKFKRVALLEMQNSGLNADDVVIECYERCMVFNMTLEKSSKIIPLIGSLAMSHGLNGTEA